MKRFSRWLNNERIDLEIYFPSLPPTLLESLAHRPHFLVMDGSVIGRGGSILTINVICRKRALLLAWIVLERSKGHFTLAQLCT